MPDTERRRLVLNRHWDRLHRLGRQRLGIGAADKVDLSGIVQKTLLEAFEAGDRFPVNSEADQAAWLGRALVNNLSDEFRRQRAGARDVARERAIEDALAGQSGGDAGWLAANDTGPIDRAARNEELDRLCAALEALPEEQRLAVEYHHLQGRPVSEVALLLGRTQASVAGLLFRGLQRLREILDEPGSEGADDHCQRARP